KVLEKTFEEWMRYRDECLRRMASEPYPAGLFCNRTFDMYACWPDGSPGTAVNVSCPFYLPWFEKVKHGLVSRRCGTDGQWVTVNGRQPWRDYSFKVLYTVGYALSLLTLISALLILTVFRKLRCTRNYIHANLFASFGLRGTSVMVKDALQVPWGGPARCWAGTRVGTFTPGGASLLLQMALGCRAAQVLMQYCILANHYWFLVEAVYLYKLLIGAVFSEKNYYRCWALNENMAYWWIIRIPILLASLINLLIFMRILKVILGWLVLRLHHLPPLAKATLTLIPLFGIHEVVFIFATDEQTTGILRYIKVFFTLFLNSFQVRWERDMSLLCSEHTMEQELEGPSCSSLSPWCPSLWQGSGRGTLGDAAQPSAAAQEKTAPAAPWALPALLCPGCHLPTLLALSKNSLTNTLRAP
uniref:Glucagon receptor n=1 Tax=Bubo bubo TaxID=30461 RepID=A0A8C0FEP6_BUBBB